MLTDTQIRKAKPATKPLKLSDSGGLYLHAMLSGGKLWRWAYRFEGKQKLMALGSYPEVSLAMAREGHARGRRMLASGVDPMAQRKAAKKINQNSNGPSFREVASKWHEHWEGGNSPHHVKATWSRLRTNVFPAIGDRLITEIQAPAIVAMVKAIQDRGKLDIAKRALETTGQIFRYAVAHGLAQRNPASDIKPGDILKSRQKENHARVDAKELPALLRAIEIYQGKHLTRLAMKMLAMTFVRTSELIGARWEEFDLEASRWNIPSERMKMRTPHIVPLSRQALDVLALLKELSGSNDLVFPGERDERRPMSNNTILLALRRMGYGGIHTGHGFRGVASTILHEQGWPHEHIELQLAHAPRNAVSAAYNHALYLEPRTKMMEAWSDFLEQTQRGGKVLPFREGVA